MVSRVLKTVSLVNNVDILLSFTASIETLFKTRAISSKNYSVLSPRQFLKGIDMISFSKRFLQSPRAEGFKYCGEWRQKVTIREKLN